MQDNVNEMQIKFWTKISFIEHAGMANQSEVKSHISYCVAAQSLIMHMCIHEHQPISSLLTHFC